MTSGRGKLLASVAAMAEDDETVDRHNWQRGPCSRRGNRRHGVKRQGDLTYGSASPK
jgi:hypothetical protein